MTRLAMIRHAATAWTEAGRVQGRADVPLSAAGRADAANWRLPADWRGAAWLTSPLARARETAALMAAEGPAADRRLVEMDWGEWEGRRLADLRRELGDAMAANEARGLDFRPPGGESPRDVQRRLAPWLADVGGRGGRVAAVCHKGVIRALHALAVGWDMTGKPPDRLDWRAAHVFDVAADGRPTVVRLNLPLAGP